MQSTTEIWKDIKGYEGLYQVSNLGRVKSTEREILCSNQYVKFKRTYPEIVLSAYSLEHNYKQVTISKNGVNKGFLVHRLVAEAFIPNPGNKPEVNHIDGDPSNNSADNLEWVTRSENMTHALSLGWDPGASRRGKHNSKKQIDAARRARLGVRATENQIQTLRTSHIKQQKRCFCIETNKEFNSLAEAGRTYNLDPTNISESIKQNRRVKHMYTFKFV